MRVIVFEEHNGQMEIEIHPKFSFNLNYDFKSRVIVTCLIDIINILNL